MRTPTLSLLLTLFLVPVASVLLFSSEAQARCTNPCMCQYGCYDGCQCPGTNGCPYCAVPGSEEFQVKAAPFYTSPEDTVLNTPSESLASNSYGVDRMIRRIGTGIRIGQCAQKNFTLTITDADSLLKLDPYFFQEDLMQEQTLALQISKNELK